jgi:branched-chain amino acid transport system permease protein
MLLLLAAVAVSGSVFGGPSFEREVTLLLVFVVIVVGMYTFIGLSGVMSFGHTSFMLIGAYVTAVLTLPVGRKEVLLPDLPAVLQQLELHPFGAAVASILVAALFAALIGIPLMRLRGIAAGLSLLATLIIVYTIANQWEEITRGRQTMMGVPRETDLLRAFLVASLSVVAAYFFSQSRHGLRLKAAREDEVAAEALGARITADRRVALTFSAAIVGLGGFLYAQYLGSFNPDAFWLPITFLTFAMLVVGGKNSLSGAIMGVVIVALFAALLRRFEAGMVVGPIELPSVTGAREIGLALLMLAILIKAPAGLTGGQEYWQHDWWRRLTAFRIRRRSSPGSPS